MTYVCSMKRTNLVSIAGVAGVVLFVAATILGGLQMENYSHLSRFISESYAIGTPHGPALRFGGFLPSGFLLALFAFSINKWLHGSSTVQLGLIGVGIFYGLGTVVTSIFPCDAGCNPEMINPSISQLIHNLTGMLTYLVTPVSLALIGFGLWPQKEHRPPALAGIVCAGTSFLFVLVLFSNPAGAFSGLFQRLIEGSILAWFLIAARHIFTLRN
jgi:hypothetical protein